MFNQGWAPGEKMFSQPSLLSHQRIKHHLTAVFFHISVFVPLVVEVCGNFFAKSVCLLMMKVVQPCICLLTT